MQGQNKWERDMRRLEEAQKRAHEQMAQRQQRMDQRFDRMRQGLARKYGETSDNQQRIVDAALELLKEDGLNNLSLRKLAAKLDMKAPALYWHFSSKEVLVDYMAETILNREFKDLQPKPLDAPWQDWLTGHMLKLRKAMLAFPDGARVVAGAHLHPAVTLGKFFEVALESLENDGMDIENAMHILMTASTYTFGFVIEEQSSPSLDEIDILSLNNSVAKFPHIMRATPLMKGKPQGLDYDYRIGLGYIIRGAVTSD